MIEAYFVHLLILIGIYLILAISLQLSIGYTGLLNFGHIAFFGIGAYTSALLALGGFPFIFSLVFAGIISMIFGFILAIPTRRLKGDYLALITMGFGFVIYAVALNWTKLTRGPLGIPGIPKPSILGISFSSNFMFLILTAIIALLSYFILNRIVKSKFGKVMEAVRDDELSARVLGKAVLRLNF